MINLSERIGAFRSAISRLVRGLLLVLWILVLTLVALGSLQGSIADFLLSSGFGSGIYEVPFRSVTFSATARVSGIVVGRSESQQVRRCPSADQVLWEFRAWQSNPPPVDAVLDVISPNWAGAISPKVGRCTEEDEQEIFTQYHRMFSKVGERMRSLARNDSGDPKLLVVDSSILPPSFKDLVKISTVGDIKLPPEVQDWVAAERIRNRKESQARALVGTFLLLSVLGAFGALIFLIRDYISLDDEKKLSHYIFRPVLGIFLAVAVFIVDILAHTVISTASILDIRAEPLYILALGAGLLSERAYDAVRRRADSALTKYGDTSREHKERKPMTKTQQSDTENKA